MRAQTNDRLGADRLARINRCIDGQCGHTHNASVSTAYRGGCGQWLHVETCAQMGRGCAALGNFTCVECRIGIVTESVTDVSAIKSD